MALSVTRQSLKVFALRALAASAMDDTSIARVERAIENALDLLAAERRFSFQQDTADLVTTAYYGSGTSSSTVTIPSTTSVDLPHITGSLPTDVVGAFLEINGEPHWYEIVTRTDDDTVVTRFPYRGNETAGTTGVAYKIVYPYVDMPGNFYKAQALIDVESGDWLEEVPYDAQHILQSERAGVGTPDCFSIVAKRNDPNQWQLMLYPPPDVQRQYQLVYFRMPGWYTTATPATSAWARQAPAGTSGDTYYVDWPDKLMFVLDAAVLAMVAREIKPSEARNYLTDFYVVLNKAANFDKKSAKPMRLGGGAPVAGTRYNF